MQETAKSVRTEYREKRIRILEDLIMISIQLIECNAYQLEKINFDDFKKVKKDLQNMLLLAKDV